MHQSGWQVKRPLLACGGIAVAVTALALQASLALTLVCVLSLVLLFSLKRLWLCAAVALCFLLVAVGYRHIYIRPTANLTGQTDTIQGQVTALPTHGRMYTVRITDSTYLPTGSRVMLRCPDDASLSRGDTFTAQVELLTVSDNQTYYRSHGAFVCAFPATEENSLQATNHTREKDSALQRLRTALVAVPRRILPTRESGLLAALCFGDTGFVEESDTDAFRGSGLSHLLVVSGLHLSMVVLAMRRLFRRFGMYPCCVLTLGVTWLFALFVGATPSILRAAMMLSLWLVGCMLFCRSDGLNTLGLAAILLLAGNPFTVWNVGFQLSFAATFGVLLLAPRLVPPHDPEDADAPWWDRLWRWVWYHARSILAVSVSALLFSLPVACYHYGGFPLLSLPANLLAAPVAGSAMLCGWLGALCGLVPFLGWLSNGFLLIAGLLARYMAAVAHALSPDWGWVNLSQLWQWLLLAALCILTAVSIRCRIPWKWLAVVLLTLTVLTVGVGWPLATAPVRLTVVPVDNAAGFILQQRGRCALILTRAQELDEVVYDTPSFQPDIVFILDGDAAAILSLDRWPKATILAATPNDWTVDSDRPITPCGVGTMATLWQDCRLIRLTDGWTLLQIGGETVCIGTDPNEPCPYPDCWRIYVGGVPATPPDTPYTIVCNATWLRRHGAVLTGQETILYDETATFTPLRGEWRRLLWL